VLTDTAAWRNGHGRLHTDKFPVPVRRFAVKVLKLRLKIADLDRSRIRQTIETDDAAIGRRFDQSPLVFTGERIHVQLAQMTPQVGIARILEQLVQRCGRTPLPDPCPVAVRIVFVFVCGVLGDLGRSDAARIVRPFMAFLIASLP
jgi:hypothetical protein